MFRDWVLGFVLSDWVLGLGFRVQGVEVVSICSSARKGSK